MNGRWPGTLGFLAATGAALACLLGAPQPGFAAFGPGGKETLGIGPGNVNRMLGYPGGKLLAFGPYAGKGTGQITRLTASGAIDTSFGENGHVAISFADVRPQRDGRILVLGSAPAGSGGSDLSLTRLLPSGRPDASFGGDGTVLVDLGRRLDVAGAVGVARDGKLLVAGVTANRFDSRTGIGTDQLTVVARLLPSGALDRSFAGDGRAVLPAAGEVVDLANGPRGGVVAATNGMIFRLRSGGALDRSFGSEGSIIPGLATEGGLSSLIEQVATLPGGRLLVAGSVGGRGVGGSPSKAVVVRYRPDGDFDRSFGRGGVARAAFDGSFYGKGFVALPDGRVVLAGQLIYPDDTRSDFAAVCFDSRGDLDRRFGRRGRARVDFGGWDMLYSVALQSPDRVVLAGAARTDGKAGSEGTALVRLPLTRRPVR